jgi:hypothetical protein
VVFFSALKVCTAKERPSRILSLIFADFSGFCTYKLGWAPYTTLANHALEHYIKHVFHPHIEELFSASPTASK